MYLEEFTDSQGKPRLRLKGNNGQVIMSGEAYASVSSRERTIRLIQHFVSCENWITCKAEKKR